MGSSLAERDYFQDKGLPYELTCMSQLFGAISTSGSDYAVVAEVGDLGTKQRYYVGYHSMREQADVVKSVSRSRKFKVNRVVAFKAP